MRVEACYFLPINRAAGPKWTHVRWRQRFPGPPGVAYWGCRRRRWGRHRCLRCRRRTHRFQPNHSAWLLLGLPLTDVHDDRQIRWPGPRISNKIELCNYLGMLKNIWSEKLVWVLKSFKFFHSENECWLNRIGWPDPRVSNKIELTRS